MGACVSLESSYHFRYLGAFTSYALFSLNKRYLLPLVAPASIKNAASQTIWKWENTVNSLLHSSVTGLASLYLLCFTPRLSEDLIDYTTKASLTVNSITVGYFIYDFIDLALNNFRRSRGLLLHHFLVTICFGLALVTTRYQGYAMVALLVEINSIFLHLRQLLIIHGVNKQYLFYRVNSLVTIGTFLVFRFVTLSYQARWLYMNQNKVACSVVNLGFFTSAVIMVLNIVLVLQVLKKDFFSAEIRMHSQ